MNTGFGGSADTRTHGMVDLQNTLIRELHSGILPISTSDRELRGQAKRHEQPSAALHSAPVEDSYSNSCMPDSWARASIIVRVNSLVSGQSGVRPAIIQSMIELLRNNIVPRIPLRGSISASGDLMPLSYIGGTLQGDPGITVWAKNPHDDRYRVTTADVALSESSLQPIKLMPKEGLALINGTAVSAGVAALAMHDANCLAAVSQVLTAMSVEALCGARESFDPIFAELRPHPGQIEAARNIHGFLSGSAMTTDSADHRGQSLRQDRYSIRTASQWIGPVLEDLLLANRQVIIECNSATDNPLIDVERDGRSFHGGNFQAKVITSAMEKTRSGLQSLGQMLFAQCTELINPKLNFGLPANLTADQPSESFVMKPLDIMVAALQSELGFLSNSAGSHVQSAEMGNQALNSLALISARYTHTALDVLTQLASAHVLALCQALDLRAMKIKFLATFKPLLMNITEEILATTLSTREEFQDLQSLLWQKFNTLLDQTASMDTTPRFLYVVRSLQPTILDLASTLPETILLLKKWTVCCSTRAAEVFGHCRDEYCASPDASPYLGVASCRIYQFVRNDLSVPFLRTKDLINLRPGSLFDGGEVLPRKSEDAYSVSPKRKAQLKRKRSDFEGIEHAAKGQDSNDLATDPMQACELDRRQTSPIKRHIHASNNRSEQIFNGIHANDDQTDEYPTVGFYISVIYEAFRSGLLYGPIFACLDEVRMQINVHDDGFHKAA